MKKRKKREREREKKKGGYNVYVCASACSKFRRVREDDITKGARERGVAPREKEQRAARERYQRDYTAKSRLTANLTS